jgi:hypothetical protein
MLTLTGTIRAVAVLPARRTKTGDMPERSVLQVEGQDSRGLVALFTLTVPDLRPYEQRIGETISVPVRAWAPGATVNLAYEASA